MKEIRAPFREHLKKTQNLELNAGPHSVIDYLHDQLEAESDPILKFFLQGELAFYSKDYKNALKNYLQVHDVPDYQFFCHRASALLSHDIGQKTKALIFANKALKMHPEDLMTLNILNILYTSFHEEEKAEAIREHIDKLQQFQDHPLFNEILTDIKELADHNLKDLHACNEPLSEELFTLETPAKEAQEPFKENEIGVAKEILREFVVGHKEPGFLELVEDQDLFISFAKEHMIKNPEALFSKWDASHVEDLLESSSKHYQKQLEDYLQKASSRPIFQDNLMMLLNTWNKAPDFPMKEKNDFNDGLFIRFGKKGIAINPGRRFLEALHEKNFTLLDIDYVIVTHPGRETVQNLSCIFELASKLNSIKPHLIHYYLNQIIYDEMIQFLQPLSRKEKSTIHCLDIYLDSPHGEKIELEKEFILHYFLTPKSFNPISPRSSLNLGIKLELEASCQKRTIAYVSDSSWSPVLPERIGPVDILIVGFGSTEKTDLEKEQYLNETLGYYGTLSLLQEAPPLLALITEFDRKIAGARLEIIKKIRENLFYVDQNPAILPGDPNLFVDLAHLKVQCSITKEWINPHVAKIVQGADPDGGFLFLSPSSYI